MPGCAHTTFEAVRMLGRELSTCPVAMRITIGTLNCPPDMWRMVAALLTIWSSARRLNLQVITSTIGRIPPAAARSPHDERGFRQGGIQDPIGAELVQQPLAARVASALRRRPRP